MRMTAAAVPATLFGVGAANAGLAALFRTEKIEDHAADDGRNDHDEHKIHHVAFTSLDDQFARSA